jgi:hypothetical protein
MSINNIFNDISSVYIEEVLKPQLGKASEGGEGEKSEPQGGGDEASAKRIRQAVYDIRYRARREDIPVDNAFNQYMSHTSMNAIEKTNVKEKLGIGAGAPVKEDAKPGEHYLRVVPKRGTGEKAYTRKFDPSSETDRSKRHKLQTRGIKTFVTKHGSPYDASNDQDGDGDNDFADVMSARMQASGVDKNRANQKVEKKPYNKKQKENQQESFSSWRTELFEINKDELSASKKNEITEDPKILNKVVINPPLEEAIQKMGGEVLDVIDITEEFISEEVQIATQYFYEQGLNDYGIDILIQKLGLEEFCNYVQDLSGEYVLLEWRRGSGGAKIRGSQTSKGGKHISTLKGGAKTSAIRGTAEHKGRKAEKETSGGKSSGMTDALKSQSEKARRVAVKTAKVKQPETKTNEKETKKGIGAAISGALGHIKNKAQQDTKLLKKSFQTAKNVATLRSAEAKAVYDAVRERGKKVEQSPGATRARRKATVAAGRAAQSAAPVVKKAAETLVKKLKEDEYDAFGESLHPNVEIMDALSKQRVKNRLAKSVEKKTTGVAAFRAHKKEVLAKGGRPVDALDSWQKKKLQKNNYEMVGNVIGEKAESEQQQKLFGLALSVKRGETPRSEVSAEVLKIVDSMSEKKIRDFAKTKHAGIPKKVEEAVTQVQQGNVVSKNQVQQKQQNTQDLQQKQKQEKLQQQKPQQNTSAINQVLNAKKNADVAQQKLAQVQKSAAQKNVNLQSLSASYESEGEMIDERRREEKGTPRKPRDPAFELIARSMGSNRLGVQPRGVKQVPGQKPPVAGEYGGPLSPAQKLAKKKTPKTKIGSRFD